MKAYIFPGQGSQYSTMGEDILKNYPNAERILNHADEVLEFKLSSLLAKGNKNEIKQTVIAQLSIFIYSYMQWISMSKPVKYAVAGHSLGEYSALVAVESLKFEDALKLIKKRAEHMNASCNKWPGKMLAVIGIEEKIIEEECRNISKNYSNFEQFNFSKDPYVALANYNSDDQIVISGNNLGIELAKKELYKLEKGKLIELKVQGAFHTMMMNNAKNNFLNDLKKIEFSNPILPIYQNVDAKIVKNSDRIKDNLKEQIVKPVLWRQTIKNMYNDGYNDFEEIGPKKVLTKLASRIKKDNLSYNNT